MLPVPLLLDGAMGTALLARGLPAGALPEEWALERPGEVASVHAAHAAAGAGLLLTCTFNVAAPRLEARIDPSRTGALCAAAVRLARGAAPGVLVAGDLGPTGLAGPGRPADPGVLADRYARAAHALAGAGADLLWIESQWDLAEALAALSAARESGLPAAVTFAFRESGGAFAAADGTAARECLQAVADAGAAAVGVNCVPPGQALADLAAWAAEALPVPFAAKPSPGLPGAVLAPAAFAAALVPALRARLRLAGGCCGATAEHLRALGQALAEASGGARRR
jgi:5-methyltetrahydrofolate--homocysteine methyltransferase